MASRRLLLAVTLLAAVAAPVWAADNCYCVDAWTATYRSKASNFPPRDGDYEYSGVIEGLMGSYYKPCVCTDVVRLTLDMVIISPGLYAESNDTVIIANITETLDGLLPSIQDQDGMRDQYANVLIKVKTKTAPSSVSLGMEFVLRGTNEAYGDIFLTALEFVTEEIATSKNILPFIGSFTHSGKAVVKCSGDPPDAPTGTTRAWNSLKLPPTEATYDCPSGQFVSPLGGGVSTCDHTTLAWTTFPALSCSSGCGEDPPNRPIYSAFSWDNTTRSIGHVVDYYCETGYRSGDGSNSSTTCESTGWTALPPTYFCSEKPCAEDIPQVPAHAATNFRESRRMAKTVVKYWCLPGYRAPGGRNTSVLCDRGLWSEIRKTWKCKNLLALNLADQLKGEMDVPDDELTKEEKQRKLDMATNPLYFWIITLPSIIAMLVGMMLCLCCTRTDSPLYYICAGHRNKSHKNYMQKFGNN